MNNHFKDATFINFFSRLANYVLHDLIDLSEGDFDTILRKNVILKFFVFRKHFDMLTLSYASLHEVLCLSQQYIHLK